MNLILLFGTVIKADQIKREMMRAEKMKGKEDDYRNPFKKNCLSP